MKKENIEVLKKFETDMITAMLQNYSRPIPTSALMEIDRIYTEETGIVLNVNFSCSVCVLKLLKKMGKVYFKEVEVPDKYKDKIKV